MVSLVLRWINQRISSLLRRDQTHMKKMTKNQAIKAKVINAKHSIFKIIRNCIVLYGFYFLELGYLTVSKDVRLPVFC